MGTSAGDLVAEKLELGYLFSVGIFAGASAIVAVAHFRFKLNAILAFWIAYILTRPLGTYLSQPVEESGLGLGTILTSVIFLTTILALVVYLSVTKRDLGVVTPEEAHLKRQAGLREARPLEESA